MPKFQIELINVLKRFWQGKNNIYIDNMLINQSVDRRMAEIISFSWNSKEYKEFLKSDHPSLTLEAPVFDVSGYAASSRSLLKGLAALENCAAINHRWFKGAVDIRPYESDILDEDYILIKDQYGNLFKYCLWIDKKEVDQIQRYSGRQSVKDHFIIHMAPYSKECDHFKVAKNSNPGFKTYIGSTMFETNMIPDNWVSACNKMDYIWVPTTFMSLRL